MKIVIEYDPINRSVSISENDFTSFEAFGMLEAAKAMIANDWLEKDNDCPRGGCE